jgi:hypothetical protein
MPYVQILLWKLSKISRIHICQRNTIEKGPHLLMRSLDKFFTDVNYP